MAFIYGILPEYTRSLDTIIERSATDSYPSLKGFTDSIDESVFKILSTSIKEILTFTDVFNINEKYISHFSFLLGYRWNDYIETNIQRTILANVLQFYKRKGTNFSFHYSLYVIDPAVTLYEPYRNLFRLNKSKLNDHDYLPSRDYYSYGIIVIDLNNFIPELYEIIENVRPAGWKLVILRKEKEFTDLNLKPKEDPRLKVSSLLYFTNTNPSDYNQYQHENSMQFTKFFTTPLTMYGVLSLPINCLASIEQMHSNTLYYPKEDLGYTSFVRYGIQYCSTTR